MTACHILSPADDLHRVHTYYKATPVHPDGRHVLAFRFRCLAEPGQLVLLDVETGNERLLAEAEVHSYHTGANAYFCDRGRSVIYREAAGTTAVLELASGRLRRFAGEPCNYCGYVDRHFIQVDADYPLQEQGEMGVWLVSLDDGSRRCLATVDQLLAAHPLGNAIRQSGLLFRLGGEISPDQRLVRLGLLTRRGGLLKDFFTCPLRGEPVLTYHGKLGSHPGWSADGRTIYTLINPWRTLLGELPDQFAADERHAGLLGGYDLESRTLAILSDHKISGGSHVAASPDGRHVVLDQQDEEAVTLFLYDARTGTMRPIHREPWQPPDLRRRIALIQAGDPAEKRYDVSAHAVFSPDGRSIIFNSFPDGTIRVKALQLEAHP